MGRAGEKRGDVAGFVVTKLLSNNFHAGEMPRAGRSGFLILDSVLWIIAKYSIVL